MHLNLVQIVFVTMTLSLIIILFLMLKRRKQADDYLIKRALETVKLAKVKQVIVPDGIGGLIEIEQLIQTPQGILLLQTYPHEGHLYGSEEIDQWTQIISGRSYHFPNPLRHIKTARQAVMTLVPEVPIYYRVIFGKQANFPKGQPEGISLRTSLEQDLANLITNQPQQQQQQTKQAWDKLLRIARKEGQAAINAEE